LPYSVRRMTREDLAQVTEIDREAFPTQWPPANYRQELQNRLAHYVVACDDNRTAEAPGVIPRKGLFNLLSIMPWVKRLHPPNDAFKNATQQYIVGFSGIWVMADEAHITNIAVRQQYQGQGIGELMLIATIDLSRGLKASSMTLEVRVSNLVAQNLYSKYGFAKTGVRRGYYLDNREDAIIMSAESIESEPFQARLQTLREALAKKLELRQNTE
jgi:ribosomal-protein-alanine N-acetyltransferase